MSVRVSFIIQDIKCLVVFYIILQKNYPICLLDWLLITCYCACLWCALCRVKKEGWLAISFDLTLLE
jgi:hypothetical protein